MRVNLFPNIKTNLLIIYTMQKTLHFTPWQGSRASSSAFFSTSSFAFFLSTLSTRPSVPRRPRGSTASSPLPTDDDTELGDQDDSISREPPLAD